MNSQFYGVITAREEFLYPDSVLSPLPDSLFIPCPLNGMPGIQLLLQTKGNTVSIELDSFSSEESETCNSSIKWNAGNSASSSDKGKHRFHRTGLFFVRRIRNL